MRDNTVFCILRRQITEGTDSLFCIIVDHHLHGVAEEDVQSCGQFLSSVRDISCELWCQIDTELRDQRTGLTVSDGETETGGSNGGETDNTPMADGGQPITLFNKGIL